MHYSRAPHFKTQIVKDLKCHSFSLVIDETTDISTKKSLAVVVRYWKDGHVRDRFLDLIEVHDDTAASLFQSVKCLLDENSIPYHQVVGFAADNVNTMMGDLTGVQRRLKEISPNIYVQGCSCHSLHLCASAATKKLPNTLEQFVRDIYSYFSHITKRLDELKECQVFANEKPHKLLKPSQTRWLSLRSTVDRILEQWNSLTLFFQREALEENLPTAKSLLNALHNQEFKVYMLFMSYVLELVIKLNLELQSESPKSPVLLNRITSLYKTVLKNFIDKKIIEEVQISQINIKYSRNYLKIEDLYLGAKVDAFIKSENCQLSPQVVQNFRLQALDFYIELCSQIKARFNFEDVYLKFAANFTPEIALKGEVRSIADFINLFPNIKVDIEAANTEWQLLSEIHIPDCNPTTNISKFWNAVSKINNGLGEPMFSNLMNIVSVILSLPHSSAAAERVFSDLNNTKTALRNKLLIKTCSSILQVKDAMKLIPGGAVKYNIDKILLNYTSHCLENVDLDEN